MIYMSQIEVAPGLVAVITQLPFVVALLGITYSIMSTSWDPDVSKHTLVKLLHFSEYYPESFGNVDTLYICRRMRAG